MKVKTLFILSLYVLAVVLLTDAVLHHGCMMTSDVLLAMMLLYPLPGARNKLPRGLIILCVLITVECLLGFLFPELVRNLSCALHAAFLYGYLMWLQMAPYLHRCHTLLYARRLRILQIYTQDISRSYLFSFMTLFTTVGLVLGYSPLGRHPGVLLLWMTVSLPVALALYCQRVRALFYRRPPFQFRGKALRKMLSRIRVDEARARKNRFELDAGLAFYRRIVDCVTRGKSYLLPDFSMAELSRQLGTNTLYVSRTINAMTGRTYPSFINFFRVRYSVALYKTNPMLRVHMLSDMCGFHSTVTYTAAFKAETGYTPGEYFARIQEGEAMPEWPEYPSRTPVPGWKDEILAF